MGIAVGILFIAVGAILKFAVTKSANGVDLPTVGVILMVVGVLAIVLDLIVLMPRRRRAVSTTSVAGQPTVRHEYNEGGI